METTRDDIDPTSCEETISGVGIWTGLLPLARQVRDEHGTDHPDFQRQGVAEHVARQHERYEWFASRIDTPRHYRHLTRILERSPTEPSAWERAMVELTLLDRTEAEVYLQRWEPPRQDLEIDTFRRICLAKCR